FGRRHPGAFLAGSMLMGFALARFATTSAPRRTGAESYGGDYGQRTSGAVATPGGPGYPGTGAGTGVGGARLGGSAGGSASADVARTGAAHPSSAGTTGMAYGAGGSGTPGSDYSSQGTRGAG